MENKNHYRVVLNAVLKLPWLEGLGSYEFVDDDNLCCAVGAVVFGSTPQTRREFDIMKMEPFLREIGKTVEYEIENINDGGYLDWSPLNRKHRMIVWLRERADARDAEIARSRS